MNLCIVCEQRPPIENSHVIPKFAYRRMKRSTPVKTMRHSSNPGRPLQDGVKGPYLCSDCEGKFSRLETYFCNTLLDPYEMMLDATKAVTPAPIAYDERLSQFLSSVHFRWLKYLEIQNPKSPIDAKPLLDRLKLACLSSNPSPAGVHHYLWFLHPVRSVLSGLPPGINTYYFFATDGFTFHWHRPEVQTMSYVKLPGFGLLVSDNALPVIATHEDALSESRVQSSGSLDPAVPEDLLLQLIGNDIKERVTGLVEQESRIPERQKQKIEAEIAADPKYRDKMRHKMYCLDCDLLGQQVAHQAVMQKPAGDG